MGTRETLIEAGLEALISRGYEGMGIGPLLASVTVPKGSFYHFFDSKEAFVGTVLDAYAEHYLRLRRERFTDVTRTPLSRLMSYFETLVQEMDTAHPVYGCLYGVLAQSRPSLGPDLAGNLRSKFDAWESDLADLIVEAQRSGEVDPSLDPRDAARHLIDLYEGTVLRARAMNVAPSFHGFRAFAARALGAQAFL